MKHNLRPPEPVFVLDLFPQERAALIDLLRELTEDEWEKPTVCTGWSVRDVALHILGGDLGNISRRRDYFTAPDDTPQRGESIVTLVNRINDEWVEGARRLSPRVITDLLVFSGPQIFDYFASLDVSSYGEAVSWAGLSSAPVWLDVAREYTERWLHQQHIRDAVGKPGLTDRRFMAPVLAAFAFALPPAFRDIEAAPGTTVHLHISGEAGGDWSLVREGSSENRGFGGNVPQESSPIFIADGGPQGHDYSEWALYAGAADAPKARVDIDQDTAWRLFTKGVRPEEAEKAISFEGDRQLGRQALCAVAIIA
jgi:uncharacterized protein (TIGR03083 family)